MKRYAIPKTEDFLERQACFDFGRVARVVLPILIQLRKDLRAWEKPARLIARKTEQLLLNLFCTIQPRTTS